MQRCTRKQGALCSTARRSWAASTRTAARPVGPASACGIGFPATMTALAALVCHLVLCAWTQSTTTVAGNSLQCPFCLDDCLSVVWCVQRREKKPSRCPLLTRCAVSLASDHRDPATHRSLRRAAKQLLCRRAARRGSLLLQDPRHQRQPEQQQRPPSAEDCSPE